MRKLALLFAFCFAAAMAAKSPMPTYMAPGGDVRSGGDANFDSVYANKIVVEDLTVTDRFAITYFDAGSLLMTGEDGEVEGLSCDANGVPVSSTGGTTTLAGIGANDSTLTFGAGSRDLFYSLDDGATSAQSNSRPFGSGLGLTEIAFNGLTGIATMSSGRIARTTDGGITWDSVYTGSTKNVGGGTWDAINSQFIAVTSTIAGSPDILTSPDGITWTNQTYGTDVSVRDVKCGTLTCVTVAAGGVVKTSPTGVTWTSRTSGTANNLWGVTYSPELTRWVAVGASGTVIYSTDAGVTWATATAVTAQILWRVRWNGTAYVAVGNAGAVISSTDGITWTLRTSGTGQDLFGATVKDGVFYAVGESGIRIKSEDNGVTWSTWGLPTWACETKSEIVNTVLADNTDKSAGGEWTFDEAPKFSSLSEGLLYQASPDSPMVAIPNGATGQTLISRGAGLRPDWENPQAISAFTTGSDFVSNPVLANTMARFIRVEDTTWMTGGGAFFDNPVADNDSSRYITVTNRTGMDWASVASGGGQQLIGGASNGTRLVVSGGSGVIRYSDNDGTSWTAATSPVSTNLRAVHWNGAQYMIAGDVVSSQGVILTDADGAGTWTRRTTGVPNIAFFRVAYDGSRYVAVGSSGTIITSDDAGVSWTSRTSGTANNLRGATWDATNSQFVVTGASGTILTSADGITWATQTSGVSIQLQSVTYYDGLLVTVGDISGGTAVILTSTDGVTWVRRTTSANSFLQSVNQLGGVFVTGGNSGGNVQVSQDGITWTPVASGTTATISAVATTTTHIFVVGGSGAVPGMVYRSAGEFRNYVYASEVDRTAETGKLDSSDVLYTAQPETVTITGQVEFDVDGIEAADLPYTFDVLRGFKNTAYESNADRAAETDPMGDTMYAYSGTPLVVDIPLLLSYSVAILTPADVPFNFDVVTIADMIYALFVVQNASLAPGPYYCYNAVYDFGVDNRWEFGAEADADYASCQVFEASTGIMYSKFSNAVGDAGDPITWVDAMLLDRTGLSLPLEGGGPAGEGYACIDRATGKVSIKGTACTGY